VDGGVIASTDSPAWAERQPTRSRPGRQVSLLSIIHHRLPESFCLLLQLPPHHETFLHRAVHHLENKVFIFCWWR
jgi:hypothetical protein